MLDFASVFEEKKQKEAENVAQKGSNVIARSKNWRRDEPLIHV